MRAPRWRSSRPPFLARLFSHRAFWWHVFWIGLWAGTLVYSLGSSIWAKGYDGPLVLRRTCTAIAAHPWVWLASAAFAGVGAFYLTGRIRTRNGRAEQKNARSKIVSAEFSELVGTRLLEISSIFATPSFEFGNWKPPLWQEERFSFVLECHWRLERDDEIVTGFDDVEFPAIGNADSDWTPGSQSGSLQEQRLVEWLGAEPRNGAIVAPEPGPMVEQTRADEFGGFRLLFSDGSCLPAFPSGSSGMEWMLRKQNSDYLVLMDRQLAGPLSSGTLQG